MRALFRWRWFAHFCAWQFGYFWLPCPSCGEMFGGMESSRSEHYDSVNAVYEGVVLRSQVICPPCIDRGEGCRDHARLHRYHQGCEFAQPADDEPHGLRITSTVAEGKERSDP